MKIMDLMMVALVKMVLEVEKSKIEELGKQISQFDFEGLRQKTCT